METIILDSKGQVFISEVLKVNNMQDLPDNVFLNKVTTGCGMTSVALSNDVPYVICVPKRNLILNKLKWCEERNIDIIGVYAYQESGVGVEEIESFQGNKILTTYDSLHKVVTALTNNGRINNFKILIDEAHELIKAGNYRYGAIDSVLDNYTKFKSFIFGTATPIDDRYQHPKLRGIQKVQIKWYDLEPVTVNYCRYEKDLLKAAAIAAIRHLTGEETLNGHFFINSVSDIASIIRHIQKGGYSDASKIRIITANNDENQFKIIHNLGKGYKISCINSEVRNVNFYTSTAFEGVDIHDENALTYIISDGSKNHSKIDVLVTLPQIIGRVRDSKITNFVNLLYSPNKYYSHTTEAEFEHYTKKKLEEAARYIERYNVETEEMIKDVMFKGAEDNVYLLVKDENTLVLNETALYSEMQNFKTINTTYYYAKHNKKEKKEEQKEVIVNEIKYLYKPDEPIEITNLNKAKLGGKVNFKMLCEMYNSASFPTDRINIAKVEPLIEKAFNVLGYEKMKALEFVKKDIEKELILRDKIKSGVWKIANLLDLRVGEWISVADVVEKLTEIYDTLNIKKTIKSTDLKEYYEVKETSKRINKIKTKGYVVIANKFRKT